MSTLKPLVLLAAILAVSATGARAQTSASPPTATGTPSPTMQGMPMSGMPMGGMPGASGGMMGMMEMMMGQSVAGHVEGRIAFLKTELKITDAQMALWNAVADAIRAAPKDMSGMSCMSMMQQSSTLPEKLAAREKTMTAHLEAFRRFKVAVDPLYASLNDDQKKTTDQLLVSPMSMMGMGMM